MESWRRYQLTHCHSCPRCPLCWPCSWRAWGSQQGSSQSPIRNNNNFVYYVQLKQTSIRVRTGYSKTHKQIQCNGDRPTKDYLPISRFIHAKIAGGNWIMCEYFSTALWQNYTGQRAKFPWWSLTVQKVQNITSRTNFELLHLQNPYFYFFAKVPKMPKDIHKNKKGSTIKLVLKMFKTLAENNFIKLLFFQNCHFSMFPLVKTQLALKQKNFLVIESHLKVA